jgi:hypothetical protein
MKTFFNSALRMDRTRRFSIIPKLFLLFASCSGHASTPYIVMRDLPSWAPGEALEIHQIVATESGDLQVADLVDNKVVGLNNDHHKSTDKNWFDLKPFFELENDYTTPSNPGHVIEGHTTRVVFVFHDGEQTKFISGDTDKLPQSLMALRIALKGSVKENHQNGYLSANLMPKATTASTNIDNLPPIESGLLDEFPELGNAINQPFLLVSMSPARQGALTKKIQMPVSALFIKSKSGDAYRLELYP